MKAEKLVERLAGKIMVDCGYDTEFPCPYTPEGDPFNMNVKCQHEDKDLCLWQIEQAKDYIPIISEFIESYNERYDNYLYREVIGYIKEELDNVK